MKVLKYILLTLILLNVPTFSIASISPTIGSLTSGLLLACIIIYYFLEKKHNIIIPLVLLGLSYYTISSLNFSGNTAEFLKDMIRYFVIILGTRNLAAVTKKNELSIMLLIGAISIIINAIMFSSLYGRYSGFYINPNMAGFICIIGFAFTFNIPIKSLKLAAQFLFTIAGLMTLSRTFILLFLLVNIIAICIDKKNILTLFAGAIGITIILGFSSLKLNTDRFNALKSIFSDEVDTTTITEATREETWSKYIDDLLTYPLLGKGYKKLHGKPKGTYRGNDRGVHNSFLMILGEAGILPFLIAVYFYLILFFKSIKQIRQEPVLFTLSIILISYLMVSHNYFDNAIILFISIWLYNRLNSNDNNSLIPT